MLTARFIAERGSGGENVACRKIKGTGGDAALDKSELRELALVRATGDTVERAYRRSNMFDKRRPMMQAWAAFTVSA
jgi:hypothetical protein